MCHVEADTEVEDGCGAERLLECARECSHAMALLDSADGPAQLEGLRRHRILTTQRATAGS